jgi:hypothetical protein
MLGVSEFRNLEKPTTPETALRLFLGWPPSRAGFLQPSLAS